MDLPLWQIEDLAPFAIELPHLQFVGDGDDSLCAITGAYHGKHLSTAAWWSTLSRFFYFY